MLEHLEALRPQLDGELYTDNARKIMYATDASAYREMPLAVAIPKSVADLQKLVAFAAKHQISLIPRAAGTSLAGQVVGAGLVVDTGKHLNQILELNPGERWVRVQPGVVRDELNLFLRPYGLQFGPETSTANRAMIGGMVGNNSCGLHSVIYGATRDHLLEAKALLADGTETTFKALSPAELAAKGNGQAASPLEKQIYEGMQRMLREPRNQQEIVRHFPKKGVTRRNTGYALDALLPMQPFTEGGEPFNLCKLIAGSEGTLCLLTEIKLNLIPLPPAQVGVVCVHCQTIHEALLVNLVALRYGPGASELVDRYILNFTKDHPEYDKNRFFITGDPGAILMVEFTATGQAALEDVAARLVADLEAAGLGYAYPVVYGEATKQVWDVRKAGLGLIRNVIGDAQPVNLIEDCAVDTDHLPDYIRELEALLQKHGLRYSMYAHAGAGELHVEPMINLKTAEGNAQFRQVLAETAALVKKYGGSLSGEHGDGRLRGEFIPYMVGQHNYNLFKQVKALFDPQGLFNPGKIVDTPPMDTFLRYSPGQATAGPETIFDFSEKGGVLRMAEACSGSGDCRKSHLMGGTMCPSYMATKDERDTTRARANMLREMLTRSDKANPFDHQEIKEVLDLCLSCKGCKAECPSNVDVGKLKAEWQQHYYQAHGVPLRSWLVGNFTKLNRLASLVPGVYNFVFTNAFTAKLAKRLAGFAQQRSIPLLGETTLRQWFKKRAKNKLHTGKAKAAPSVSLAGASGLPSRKVYLFCDEFTDYNDLEVGKAAVELLERLGYQVEIPVHQESGRTYLSKGLLKQAKKLAVENVTLLKDLVSEQAPLVGIEPSAILTFRDEYLSLVPTQMKPQAEALAKNCLLIEEFLAGELAKGHLKREQFTGQKRLVKLHGHCHQKALSSLVPVKKILSLPANYSVELIPSGCCGMAGSFGYEKEHYTVSQQIGELVLFPTVRKQAQDVIICAPGTSCRHQIKDGTQRTALHPVQVLLQALKNPVESLPTGDLVGEVAHR
ncbi:MAG: FAD-binding protein [Cytophagales bacterium]|nr:FAD-binding protein [Cytophagales bacterium]